MEPVEIFPHLYLGNALTAACMQDLQRLGITAILNVSSTCKNHFTSNFHYKNIPVDDSHNTQLSNWFSEAITFIGKSVYKEVRYTQVKLLHIKWVHFV